MKINICSTKERNVEGFLCVDIMGNADIVADLSKPWPFEDNSIDQIRAFDAIEHLPNKIHTMNEAYRCLKHDGVFEIMVPSTEAMGAFQDPTHVSFWNRNSFWYYCNNLNHQCHRLAMSHYGVKCVFFAEQVKNMLWEDDNMSVYAVLRAIKQ